MPETRRSTTFVVQKEYNLNYGANPADWQWVDLNAGWDNYLDAQGCLERNRKTLKNTPIAVIRAYRLIEREVTTKDTVMSTVKRLNAA